jgi:hypothetical protein
VAHQNHFIICLITHSHSQNHYNTIKKSCKFIIQTFNIGISGRTNKISLISGITHSDSLNLLEEGLANVPIATLGCLCGDLASWLSALSHLCQYFMKLASEPWIEHTGITGEQDDTSFGLFLLGSKWRFTVCTNQGMFIDYGNCCK